MIWALEAEGGGQVQALRIVASPMHMRRTKRTVCYLLPLLRQESSARDSMYSYVINFGLTVLSISVLWGLSI